MHRRRKRYAQERMLVQIDGSRHQWLADRDHRRCDGQDQRSHLPGAGRCARLLVVVRQLVERYGFPLALYHDRHGIFT